MLEELNNKLEIGSICVYTKQSISNYKFNSNYPFIVLSKKIYEKHIDCKALNSSTLTIFNVRFFDSHLDYLRKIC